MEGGQRRHARVGDGAARAGRIRKHGRRGHAPLPEPIPGKHGMPPRTAEDERATGRGGLPLGPEAFHAGRVFQGRFEHGRIEAAVAPGDFCSVVVDVIFEPPIPKRHERPLRDPVADRGLGREDVVEERGHVDAVCPLGRGREAERERRGSPRQLRQPREHAAVARRLGVVHLVDDAVIKRSHRREGREAVGAGKFLDRRDDELAGEIARRPGDVRHARGRDRLPERGLGLREDLGPVGDHEHPRRPAEFAAHRDHVERREPGFPKARGHGHEGFGVAIPADRGQGGEGFLLPGARSERGGRGGRGRGGCELTIPHTTQFGRFGCPGRIPLDHLGRQRRSLLPEVVKRGDEFAVEVARARRLAEQVPFDARLKGRPREVARPNDHDPARRIRDPPRLRVKRVGRATEVFHLREPGLERAAGAVDPPKQQI